MKKLSFFHTPFFSVVNYVTLIVNLHVSLTEIIDLIRNADEWI